MTFVEWIVAVAGLLLVVWLNWWFFLAEAGSPAAVASDGGVQEVRVRVQGGYEPSRIKVRAGAPVRLVFDRQERDSCTEEVVFPDFGVRRFLPPFRRTAVDLGPTDRGKYEFRCGMNMHRGTLEAE